MLNYLMFKPASIALDVNEAVCKTEQTRQLISLLMIKKKLPPQLPLRVTFMSFAIFFHVKVACLHSILPGIKRSIL